jgi:peptidyl-prolyl cis-trans isomerase A (cyclophilin A)
MRSLLAALALPFFAIVGPLQATDFPTIKAAIEDISTTRDAALGSIDLRNHFEVTDLDQQVVQFRTNLGDFNIEMEPAAAPITVANFLNYVNGARFANTFVHRSDKPLGIIQGGGYDLATFSRIATDPPIVLEYNLPNVRGTIAMARTSVQNSATSEWFINTKDNTAVLGQGNGGGYAVFGRVIGTGMTVVDAIQALPVYVFNPNPPFGQLPLVNYTGPGLPADSSFVVLNAVQAVPVFPAAPGEASVVTFSVANTNTALVTASVSASTLSLALAPGAWGTADITVTASDTNGNSVQEAFRIDVAAPPPEIAIEQGGTDIANSGSRSFPLTNVGGSADLVFTIKNTGAGPLTLTGSPKVAIDGPDAGMFTVLTQPGTPVAAGGDATFAVRFSPASAGAKSAALHIASNDTDENPFDITLNGSGNVAPTLTLPASPVTAAPTSANGAVVSFSVTADDLEDGALIPNVAPASGSTFPIGDTTVNVSATDSHGAQTTGSFVVRVEFARPAATVVNIGARSGDPAPSGPPAGTVLSTFGEPAVSDFRVLAARVTMLSNGTSLRGIMTQDDAGVESLVAFQGGPVPGVNASGATFNKFYEPVTAPDGALAFGAKLQGVAESRDFGIWTNAFGGALELALREGSDVPGLPVGARLKSVSSISIRDGELLALVALVPATGGVSLANDTALVRMTSASSATVLLREGRQLAGQPGSKIKSFSVLSPAIGSAGQGRWHADGVVVAKVALFDGRKLIVKIAANGTSTALLTSGTAATPIDPSGLLRWQNFGLPAMGGAGAQFAVAATLQQKGTIDETNDTALLASADGSTWNLVAREAAAAPVTPSGPVFASFFDPVANAAGDVAFLAKLRGAGVGNTNKTGLFAGPRNNPRLTARLGSAAPDEAGAATASVWSKFISHALPNGGGAGVIFLAETSGGDTNDGNKLALWGVDSTGKLRRLLRTSDTLTTGGPLITNISLLGAAPGAYGVARSYNATGSIALLATFSDGTQALLRVDVP